MRASDTAKAAPAIAERDLRNGDRFGGLIITEDTDSAIAALPALLGRWRLIDRNVETKIRGHLDSGAELTFHRIAINEAQVAEYDLPTKPRKEGDQRSLHVERTVEAEAMPASTMRGLLREAVEKAAEESEQSYLRTIASDMAYYRATDDQTRFPHERGGRIAGHAWPPQRTGLFVPLPGSWAWFRPWRPQPEPVPP